MTDQIAPQSPTATMPPPPAHRSRADQARTGQHDSVDGAGPAPGHGVPEAVRLSLAPAGRRAQGNFGAWWPRSRDAAAELPGLIAGLATPTRRVSRVAVQADAFANIPHQLTVNGRRVRVAWFRSLNPLTVLLTMAGDPDLTLLVIPADASPAAGDAALELAAKADRPKTPAAILAAAGIGAEAGPS